MKVVAILLLGIFAFTAEGAPKLPESFNASLLVQYIGGSCQSTIVRNYDSGKEYWTLLNEPNNIYIGQLSDYSARQSYNIIHFGPLQGCLPLRPVNGTLPYFWAEWLPTAQYSGKAEYMNTVVEVWAGMDSKETYHEVGVSLENNLRPVYTVISTDRTAVQFTWLEYTSDVTGADFSVPLECPKVPNAKKPEAGMMNLFNLGLPTPRRFF